jgi:hypothetical protein
MHGLNWDGRMKNLQQQQGCYDEEIIMQHQGQHCGLRSGRISARTAIIIRRHVELSTVSIRQTEVSHDSDPIGLKPSCCAGDLRQQGGGGRLCRADGHKGGRQNPNACGAIGAPGRLERLSHACARGKSPGCDGVHGEGVCRSGKNNLAAGICKKCLNGREIVSPKNFLVCCTKRHGLQCYCQHLREMVGCCR